MTESADHKCIKNITVNTANINKCGLIATIYLMEDFYFNFLSIKFNLNYLKYNFI